MEINTLYLDFEKGILEINGSKITKSVVLSVPQTDNWNKSRIINLKNMPEAQKQKPLAEKLEIRLYNGTT